MKIFYDEIGNITGYELFNSMKVPYSRKFIETRQFKKGEYDKVYDYKVNLQTKKLEKLDKTVLKERKIMSAQQMMLFILNNNYQAICKQTDNEYLSYQKRKEFNILTDKDKTDYEEARKKYTEATEKFRKLREKINVTADLKKLEKIKTEL